MDKKITHAMILAAGLGTRMRPITNTIPKPLIEVAGRSILDLNIDLLHNHGIENIVVNAHYLFAKIQTHIELWNDKGLVLCSEEDELLDQGGGIKQALPHLGKDNFFVLNGDAFWIDDEVSNLQQMEQAWQTDEMDFLLLVAPLEHATGYDGLGDFFIDHDGRVEFRGIRKNAPYVFTGVGIYTRKIFEDQTRRIFPLVPLYKEAIKRGRVFAHVLNGHWFHIGTPDGISLAEDKLTSLNSEAC